MMPLSACMNVGSWFCGRVLGEFYLDMIFVHKKIQNEILKIRKKQGLP